MKEGRGAAVLNLKAYRGTWHHLSANFPKIKRQVFSDKRIPC